MEGLQALDYEPETSSKAQLVTNLNAKFFAGPNGQNMVEITNMADGGRSTLIQTVDETHIRRWRRLWDIFQFGREKAEPTGTPLTEVPGIDEAMAAAYQLKGITNAEKLAALDDIVVQALGHGALTARQGARNVLKAKRADELEALLNERTTPAGKDAGAAGKKAA